MNVLLCSHLLGDVEEVCDEAVILKDGRVVHHADLEEERRSNRRFVELEVTGDDRDLAAALREHGAEGVSEGQRPLAHRDAGGRRSSSRSGRCWRGENLGVHKLTHRRDTLEEIFLKAVGHLQRTPGDERPAPQEVAQPWPSISAATSATRGRRRRTGPGCSPSRATPGSGSWSSGWWSS